MFASSRAICVELVWNRVVLKEEIYLGHCRQAAKPAKSFIESLFCDHGIEITDEQLGTNLYCFLLVGRCFIDPDRFSIKSNLVHDLCCVLCILFANELDEAITLMGLSHSIFWQVNVDDSSSLEHKLPYQTVCNPFIEVTNVDRGFFVLLPD